jgi:hypothetical protein
MRSLLTIIIGFALLLQGCTSQTKPETKSSEFHNKDFDWTITIPEGFQAIPAEEWGKMQNKGAEAIEKTYDQKIENHAKTIFAFRSNELNYFESNYQPYDVATDGAYEETIKGVNDMLYGTFVAQMPAAKLDSTSSKEMINGKEFHVFKVAVTLPNNMIMNVSMYNRLFGKREFTVNIMAVDRKQEKALLDAWKNSKFGKE